MLKIFIVYILASLPILNFAQGFQSLLNSDQADSLEKLKSNLNGLVTFAIDPKTELKFGLNKGSIVYEYISRVGEIDGQFYSYFQTGELKEWKTFDSGCKEGPSCKYYSNGVLQECGSYVCITKDTTLFESDTIIDSLTGELIISNSSFDYYSIKDGEWWYYSSVGKLIKKEKWINGKISED